MDHDFNFQEQDDRSDKLADNKEIAEFDTEIAKQQRQLIAVPILIIINLIIFFALASSNQEWGNLDGNDLISWGSNFGPLSLNTQLWRLLSGAFLHANLVHVLVNMFVLYDIGRRCERLYGTAAFLII